MRSFSIEDGNLNSATLITSRKDVYSDIDLSLDIKPSGDVYKKTDAAAVKQAVKNLLLTNQGEKPFNPSYGGSLQGLLFDLLDDDAEDEIEDLIIVSVENYEPRARVLEVDVRPQIDNNAVSVRITFQIINTTETVVLSTTITRLR